MAELTPEERAKIYEEEKARLEARQQIEAEAEAKAGEEKAKAKRSGCLTFLLVVGGAFAVFYIVGRISDRPSSFQRPISTSTRPAAQATAPTAEEEKMLKDMLETGLIDMINPSMNEVHVNPVTWASIKYDQKQSMSRFLAIYCGKKKGTGLNWVDILDSYSGKKLAKYSESLGFKVY